jgi:poly(hydroxyalkanoate) granule-associated protein
LFDKKYKRGGIMADKKTTSKAKPKTVAKPVTKAKPVSKKEDVADAANKIWKAGLGALRTAEEEGSRIFKSLMEKGEDFQNASRKGSQKQIDKVSKIIKGGVGSVKGKIDDITDQKEGIWDILKLEETFSSVMKTFGVATKKEIDILKKKIDSISKVVNELKGTPQKSSIKK